MHDNYIFPEKSIHTEDEEDKYQELHGAVPEHEPPEEDPELEPPEESDGAHFQRQEDDNDKYPELDLAVLELKPPEEDPEPELDEAVPEPEPPEEDPEPEHEQQKEEDKYITHRHPITPPPQNTEEEEKEQKKKEREEVVSIFMEETREITERNQNERFEIYDNYIYQEETIHSEDKEDEYPELDEAAPEPEPPKEDPVPQPDEAVPEPKSPKEDPEPKPDQRRRRRMSISHLIIPLPYLPRTQRKRRRSRKR